MTEPQRRVQSLLDQLVDSGAEIGLQVAAYHDGNLVVDAWSGLVDVASARPVNGDSLFTVFSCSKGITATVVHIFADRGLLAYDTPVAAYWPEFGAQGKQEVTVRQVLNHTAGIPQLPSGTRPEDLCDWSTICRGLAAERLLWEPGTRMGYHARTYGYILGEVIQRVSGRSFPQVVQEEISRPLGITNLHFGIGDAEEPRVATLEPDPNQGESASSELRRLVFPPEIPATAAVFNRPDIRRACIPSSGGIMNARSLARHYAALACDELDGVRLLTPERRRLATELQPQVVDVVQGSRSTAGWATSSGRRAIPWAPASRSSATAAPAARSASPTPTIVSPSRSPRPNWAPRPKAPAPPCVLPRRSARSWGFRNVLPSAAHKGPPGKAAARATGTAEDTEYPNRNGVSTDRSMT